MKPETPRNVLVLALSALGDLLLALPLCLAIRERFPNCRLTLLCERVGTAAFAKEIGIADRVSIIPARARRSPLDLLKALLQARAMGGELAFQTFASHGSFGNLMMRASGAGTRVGFISGRFAGLLTHAVKITDDRHRITHNLDLLRQIGFPEIKDPSDRYLPPLETRSTAFPVKELPARFGRYAVISTGSDPKLAFKRWPEQKWSELLQKISAMGVRSVFVGDGEQRAIVDRIISAAKQPLAANLAGETTFCDLAALISASELVVATDGMILHFAAAMKKLCIGIFGPSNVVGGGPFGQSQNAVSLGLPCSPCYRETAVGRPHQCTIGHQCLQQLDSDLVIQKISQHINKTTQILPASCSSS